MGVQQIPRSTSGASNTSANEYHYYGKRAVTAVIGNLDPFDDDIAASAFAREKLSDMRGPIPTNIYSK
eukprot:7999560-Pyramimonas_sp.AAC.1